VKNKQQRVSIVIPTYNSWSTLKDCLESIFRQKLQPTEVIVIDNASTDGTSKKINQLIGKNQLIKLIKNKKNLGVTGGRNRGIKEANKNSEFLFFFDHDMVADEKMLEELVKVAESNKKIGIVTPKIYYWERKDIIWSAGTDVNLLTGQTVFYGGDKGQYDEVKEVGVAPAAILVKRKVIHKIGMFDPIYFATYEDTDFCFRAKKEGFLTYYAPNAKAFHKIPYNKKKAETRLLGRTYWIARNRVVFMNRYGKFITIFWFFEPIYFLYYVILAVRYRKFKAIYDFVRGTTDGILSK